MEFWQQNFTIGLLVYSLLCFFKGVWECNRKNYVGERGALLFYPLGAYVWADAVVFGLFWSIVSASLLYVNNWWLLWTFFFVFHSIRTFGEAIYWFNQQFSTVNRNPGPERFPYKYFKDEYTTWFVYQILWQCVTVICVVMAIYSSYRWISGL